MSKIPLPSAIRSRKREMEDILRRHAFSPGAGSFGEPIVNVLEINLNEGYTLKSHRLEFKRTGRRKSSLPASAQWL